MALSHASESTGSHSSGALDVQLHPEHRVLDGDRARVPAVEVGVDAVRVGLERVARALLQQAPLLLGHPAPPERPDHLVRGERVLVLADQLRQPPRRHVAAVVHLEEAVLRGHVALRPEQVLRRRRGDRRDPAVVARDRHVGVEPGQLLLARDLRQRPSHDDDGRDHHRDEGDDDHRGDGDHGETDEATTRHASEGTLPPRLRLSQRPARTHGMCRASEPLRLALGRCECQTFPTALRRPSVPTYAYACTACGHAFEIVQSFSDDSLSVCPECEGRLRKVFSSVGVVFKGSGFYRNDARAGAKSTALSPAASTPAATPASSSTSSSTSSSSSSTPRRRPRPPPQPSPRPRPDLLA